MTRCEEAMEQEDLLATSAQDRKTQTAGTMVQYMGKPALRPDALAASDGSTAEGHVSRRKRGRGN
eukprot:CAMPEP_0206490340 /NCGR_PEP_ID=MMETSP0324_2-20121206/43980_1 /ASSEMBLY_ACC=CAM_ASM_000836 /TAXON_ID=2866 /ORGANISM="Crypthecodinium cohnii, Strain Seligo" /LENGTH=64 /DNA_ID=CAMNT_0053970597 /DNA_START=80 /DNA_END=274 /DNA_ORIENTATION=+